MGAKICYLGDDHLQGAAAYLAGILTHFGIAFDYVPSAEPPPAGFAETSYAAYVISDYPAARFGKEQMEIIADRVKNGAGLVMIGGWESFHGKNGEYHKSPLADVLPILMQSCDDRSNFAQACLIEKRSEHAILADLPWSEPPAIGGMNVFPPRPGSEILLEACSYRVSLSDHLHEFWPDMRLPLLVIGRHGEGLTAALATDVAPHWVGGFVDWGDKRIVQEIGGGTIEVGNWYAQFFRNLVAWAAKM